MSNFWNGYDVISSNKNYSLVVGFDYDEFDGLDGSETLCYWVVNTKYGVVEAKTRLLVEAKAWLVQISEEKSAEDFIREAVPVTFRFPKDDTVN